MTTRDLLVESRQRLNYQRPHSASQSDRFGSSNLGKGGQQQSTFLDEQTVKSIWKGFGSYVAKQLRNGKGVTVPKFGNFTFSATTVDLAGTTNPGERDKQHRDPVFIVGKDFVSATPLRTGVAFNNGAQVRPNDIKGVSGIIPKVKVNYTEVGANCGQPKDIARSGCEQMFRYLSDRVRKGESSVQVEIPFVGVFVVRSGIAAVSFKEDLSEETKGATAKAHYVNKLFASSINQLNLQIHDQNTAKQNPSAQMGGAMALTSDAENWLRHNLDISVQELVSNGVGPLDNVSRFSSQRIQSAHPKNNSGSQLVRGLTRYGSMRPEDLKHKSWNLQQNNHNSAGLTEQNKAVFDRLSDVRSNGAVSKRPMSAATRTTSQGSRLTNVPELGRMKLMIIANDLYRNRAGISETVLKTKKSLRDPLTSSEINTMLKKTGIFIDLVNIKALLREFGYNWNGVSCSFFDLFKSCQTFMYGTTQDENRTNTYYQAATESTQSVFNYEENPLVKTAYNYNKRPDSSSADQGKDPALMISQIKDLFYSTGKGIFDIFNEAKLGSVVDFEGLNKVVQAYSGGRVNEDDVKAAFQHISRGKGSLGFQDFEKVFKWQLPAGGEWETKAIRNIREWMYKNGLSSETTFQLLLKNAGRLLQKRLNRVDFHKAWNMTELRFSAVEIDGLFLSLDANEDGELDMDEWKQRIYEDSSNPLQMLREVISSNKLTPDDLLFKMKLRIWDAPLDFPKLCESLRRLDPTLSETQLRHLAKVLKNKDNKVEITALLRNLSGQEHETVDFRNKIFRQIYAEIHPNKEDQLLQLLENADPINDGRVEPLGLKIVLNKVLKNSIDEQTIDRFIRFLDKDKSGKIPYVEFIQRMAEVSNRDHNPFKSVVQRLAYFLESNKQSISTLLKRLATKEKSDTLSPTTESGAPINTFTQFMKAKIDKKRDEGQLRKFAQLMDIDKDGVISEIDLQTCLSHLNSDTFFKNSGEALYSTGFSSATKFFPGGSMLNNKASQLPLSEERAFEILNQIRTALISQKIAYREAFNRFDDNKDGFLNFNEFSQGLGKIITLSAPIKEKLFALMDRNQIGMVDYQNFLEVIQMSSANRLKKDGQFKDNFNWENDIIEKIKDWIIGEKITVDEAFKCFDKDFDGYISKDDLKWGLTNILKVPSEEQFPTKIDRLFRLMDFYKTGSVQLSDFQRLVNNENPYTASSGSRVTTSTENFKKSFGGTFAQTSTFDWKLSAIQQIGLVISKKFNSVKDSFEAASERLQKVTYEQFRKFLEQNRTLSGFNLTTELIQKLFSEIDPHKKGYLTENDWNNAFQSFNWNDQILLELKNAISCNFTDSESSFEFFHTFKKDQQPKGTKRTIQYAEFELAVNSLTADRFKRNEIQSLWRHLTEGGKYSAIDSYQFRSHFDDLKYTGSSTVRKLKSATTGARATIRTATSSSSTWESDIMEKLRQIIRSSSQSFEDIFRSFDEDKNGYISQVEFRNALRKLNLGLTSREIDQIMEKIDTNQDGRIDWQEFINKFKTKELDVMLKERAKDKMGRLKELMILHMTSPNDAFRFFDETKLGKLSYQEFGKLVIKLHELTGDKPPAYPVIKDLFDTIDIRKDGIIDISEWQQTFGSVTEGSSKLSIKPTPMTTWINSREFMQIGMAIAKNRKLLKDHFDNLTGGKTTEVTLKQAKQAMDGLIFSNFKGLSDEKLLHVLKVGEQQGATSEGLGGKFDYVRMLDVYKNRHAGPQL